MSDLDLCYMPASSALELFRARKLSPVEIVTAQIGRAEKLEPELKAFADTYFDEALQQARRRKAATCRAPVRPVRWTG